MTPRARTALAIVSVANLLLNLLFPVLAVRALGAGVASDALFMVFILPGVIMVLLGNSILNWAIPRLVRRVDPASRQALCWSLLWVILAGVGFLCVVLLIAAQFFLPGFAPGAAGVSQNSYALAVVALPLGLVAVIATAVTSVAQSLFTAERNVQGGEWRTLAGNSVALMCWFLFDPVTLIVCAALFALRALCIAAALLPRLGLPRRPDFSDTDLRDTLRESRVLLLAAVYYKSEPFVDRLLFASAPGGVVAAFHLAQQILTVVTQLMNRTLTAPMVAPFAERMHAGNIPSARAILRRVLLLMALVGIAVWVLFVTMGEPLVALLFIGSVADPAHIALTAQMLAILGGFMLAVLFGQVLAQVSYCTGEVRLAVGLGIFGYTLGLVMKIAALIQFGVIGMVCAISLSWLINTALYPLVAPGIYRRAELRAQARAAALPQVRL